MGLQFLQNELQQTLRELKKSTLTEIFCDLSVQSILTAPWKIMEAYLLTELSHLLPGVFKVETCARIEVFDTSVGASGWVKLFRLVRPYIENIQYWLTWSFSVSFGFLIWAHTASRS